jgi:D-alanine transaminase
MEGRLIEFAGHMARLNRSLDALGMSAPFSEEEWLNIHRQLVNLNRVRNGLVYLQITRGSTGDRDFLYPPEHTPPTIVLFTQEKPAAEDFEQAKTGIRVATVPDLRWGRRDLKTTQLLYPSMAKMEARRRGADDAWFVEGNVVTEGASSNAFIVCGNVIVTAPRSSQILHGTTRGSLLRFCAEAGMNVEERHFTLDEAKSADEAFCTASYVCVIPVTEIDGVKIGSGHPGPVTARIREIYIEEASKHGI